MSAEQPEFPFAAEIGTDRLAATRAFCERYPPVLPALIGWLRGAVAVGERVFLDEAIYHLRRKRICRISHVHRAPLKQIIIAQCPDLAVHLHVRRERPRRKAAP